MSETVLTLRDLSVYHDNIRNVLLDEVNLEFAKGQTYAVMGPSGAGKSTLLRCIAGFHKKYNGDIIIGNKNIRVLANGQFRNKISYIPQAHGLLPRYSVVNNVLVGRLWTLSVVRRTLLLYTKNDYSLAQEAIASVGMGDYTHKSVESLSGGQRQRVAIARSLVQSTDIVLLDEPVASLDPESTKGVMLLLKELAAIGKTVIMSLHQPELLNKYVDNVIYVDCGRAVLQQEASERKEVFPLSVESIYA